MPANSTLDADDAEMNVLKYLLKVIINIAKYEL